MRRLLIGALCGCLANAGAVLLAQGGSPIIVFPSGNVTATVEDQTQGDRTNESYGTAYENDLLNEIIPFVESHYSVYTDFAQKLFKD